MELVGRWWNGQWGRFGRRDIWLYADSGGFVVHARHGDSDDGVREWRFDTEPEARAWITRLTERGGEGWREITHLYRDI